MLQCAAEMHSVRIGDIACRRRGGGGPRKETLRALTLQVCETEGTSAKAMLPRRTAATSWSGGRWNQRPKPNDLAVGMMRLD